MILMRLSIAKAFIQYVFDGESRKPRERKGLDTPVVLAVNDVD